MSDTFSLHLTQYHRIPTQVVNIGGIPVGGNHPIRIQSMTTTDTMDTQGTIEQTMKMVASGCEYVRITAPSIKEAQNLQNIRDGLHKRGIQVPLIADIHFTPNAAEIAARIVEKVRVNPGNYADKKKFETIEYTDDSYQAEIERIHKRFSPLVKICKEYGTAMRIGTNHGSLSDRILSRYGDTPNGMVESAFEFIRICEDHNFHQLVISMKSSNTQVMVQAYRLLMSRMLENGRVYPLHLGVTEAGEGEDGRIKSAMGIGTLLMDGIGDTVRVSLTEAPEFEAPVARYIVNECTGKSAYKPTQLPEIPTSLFHPYEFKRFHAKTVENFGNDHLPRVIAHPEKPLQKEIDLIPFGHAFDPIADKWNMSELGADWVYAGADIIPFMLPNGVKAIYDSQVWNLLRDQQHSFPLWSNPADWVYAYQKQAIHTQLNFILVNSQNLDDWLQIEMQNAPVIWVLDAGLQPVVYTLRHWLTCIRATGNTAPMIIRTQVLPSELGFEVTQQAAEQMTLACQTGALWIDGLADGLWVVNGNENLNRAAFGVLQAARLRMTRTEYISCPSCGRTLFDLMETTAMIRSRTEHLKGVKIGIMGCIVNGPGEMADADYGYVGSGPGIISLYRGQNMVEKAVKADEAVDKLIELIQQDGNWVEKV
jgi:(E)-4-hydroxy-3-methylbut-2-enyl-diphosphate synthase